VGTDQEFWISSYGDRKAKIEIAAVPELPRDLRKRWNSFWGLTTGGRENGEGAGVRSEGDK